MGKGCRIRRRLAQISLALLVSGSFATAQAAGPPQRIIVKYKSTLSSAQQSLSTHSSRFGVTMSSVRATSNGAQVVKLGAELSREEVKSLVASLSADPSVEYAEEDVLLQPNALPDDPLYSQQWPHVSNTAGVNPFPAWKWATGKGVTVAVIDSGYRPHADLVANIVGGYDFISEPLIGNDGDGRDADAQDPGDWTEAGQCGPPSPSGWHGTHVAGIIGARANNNIGVAGLAYDAKILPLRVLGRCGGYLSDISDALIWSSGGTVPDVPANPNPARVANLSVGAQGYCGLTLQNAVNEARSRGTVVVVAAGNANEYSLFFIPTSCQGVIAVAASDLRGGRAFYTNIGAGIIDLAAPGGDSRTNQAEAVLSLANDGTTVPGNDNYAFHAGTSMAAPHVSAVAAMMLEVNPSLTPDQLEKILTQTARPFPARCSQCGSGIVDATAAVIAARRR